MGTEKNIPESTEVSYLLECCSDLDSKELKFVFLAEHVLEISRDEAANLLDSGLHTIETLINKKNEILKDCSYTSDLIKTESEIINLADLFFELVNKINYSKAINKSLKKRFIYKVIGLFKLLNESGKSNKQTIHAFISYLYFNLSRQDTIFSADRKLISLREQDRSKWDEQLINKGIYHLEKSADGSNVTIYHLESAVAAIHCLSKSYRQTDWNKIVSVYDKYLSVNDSPYVELQRASVISKIKGARQGIEEIMNISDKKSLEDNPLLYSTLGNLHLQIHNYSTALENYEKAFAYAEIEVDKKFYHQKVQICRQRLKMIEDYHFYNSF
ncbi:MAG: hypothetical protein GWN11_00805 [Candidatus Dadabacteria bacterium]|nr:hypothetical protein [Candidatus Dadabacteria bacterium]